MAEGAGRAGNPVTALDLWEARFLARSAVQSWEEAALSRPASLVCSLSALSQQLGGPLAHHAQLDTDSELSDLSLSDEEQPELSRVAARHHARPASPAPSPRSPVISKSPSHSPRYSADRRFEARIVQVHAAPEHPGGSCSAGHTRWHAAARAGVQACRGRWLRADADVDVRATDQHQQQQQARESVQAGGGEAAGSLPVEVTQSYSNTDKEWMRAYVDKPRRWTAMSVQELHQQGFWYRPVTDASRPATEHGGHKVHHLECCQATSPELGGACCGCPARLQVVQLPSATRMLLVRQQGVHNHPPLVETSRQQLQQAANKLQGRPLSLTQTLMGMASSAAPCATYSLASPDPATLLAALHHHDLLTPEGGRALSRHQPHHSAGADAQLAVSVAASMRHCDWASAGPQEVLQAMASNQGSHPQARAPVNLPSAERVRAAALSSLRTVYARAGLPWQVTLPAQPSHTFPESLPGMKTCQGLSQHRKRMAAHRSGEATALPVSRLQGSVGRWLEEQAARQPMHAGAGSASALQTPCRALPPSRLTGGILRTQARTDNEQDAGEPSQKRQKRVRWAPDVAPDDAADTSNPQATGSRAADVPAAHLAHPDESQGVIASRSAGGGRSGEVQLHPGLAPEARANAMKAGVDLALSVGRVLASRPSLPLGRLDHDPVLSHLAGLRTHPTHMIGRLWMTRIWSQDSALDKAITEAYHPLSSAANPWQHVSQQRQLAKRAAAASAAAPQRETDASKGHTRHQVQPGLAADPHQQAPAPRAGTSAAAAAAGLDQSQVDTLTGREVVPVEQQLQLVVSGGAEAAGAEAAGAEAAGAEAAGARSRAVPWRLSPAFLIDTGSMGRCLQPEWQVDRGRQALLLSPDRLLPIRPASGADPLTQPLTVTSPLDSAFHAPWNALSQAGQPGNQDSGGRIVPVGSWCVDSAEQQQQGSSVCVPKAQKRPLAPWTTASLGLSVPDLAGMRQKGAQQYLISQLTDQPLAGHVQPAASAASGGLLRRAMLNRETGKQPSSSLSAAGVATDGPGSQWQTRATSGTWQRWSGRQAGAARASQAAGPSRPGHERHPSAAEPGRDAVLGSSQGDGSQVAAVQGQGSQEGAGLPEHLLPPALRLIQVLALRMGIAPQAVERTMHRYMSIMGTAHQAGAELAAHQLATMGGAGTPAAEQPCRYVRKRRRRSGGGWGGKRQARVAPAVEVVGNQGPAVQHVSATAAGGADQDAGSSSSCSKSSKQSSSSRSSSSPD